MSAPTWGSRAVAALLAGALAACAVYLWLIAGYLYAVTCDDACTYEQATSWREQADAWQWRFQFAWASAAWLVLAAGVPLALTGRVHTAYVAICVAVGLFLGWWAFIQA